MMVSRDQCAYKKEGNADPDELFCFKTEGAIHDVECEVINMFHLAPINIISL